MRISQKFGPYDEQEYGKPWIAVITSWPDESNPAIRWGNYIGDNTGGKAEVEVMAGAIFRSKGIGTHWGIVGDDGSITECTAAAAKQAWEDGSASRAQDNPLAAISDEDLLSEVRRRGLHV